MTDRRTDTGRHQRPRLWSTTVIPSCVSVDGLSRRHNDVSCSCRIDYVNEKVALSPGRPDDNVAVAAAAAAVLPSQTAWPAVQTRQATSTAGMQAD